MKSKLWIITSVIAVVVFAFGFVGCDDKEKNNEATHNLTIQLIGEALDHTEWVVIHSENGYELIDAKAVPESGEILFADIASQRVTATFITVYRNQANEIVETSLSTISDALIGAWFWGNQQEEGPILGWADVTFNYPEGDYSSVGAVVTPAFGKERNIGSSGPPDSPTQHREIYPVCALESDGTISIAGGARSYSNASPEYYGLITEQTFVLGDTNHYEMTLDQAPVTATISVNKPCDSSTARMYRDRANGSYMYLSFYEIESMIPIRADYLPELSWDWIRLQVHGEEGNSWYYLNESYQEMPASISIPQTTLTAVYNEPSRQIESIQVTGDADVVTSTWSTDINEPNEQNTIYWSINQSPFVAMHRLPVIPDTILNQLGMLDREIFPKNVILFDYNNLSDYAGFVNEAFSESHIDVLSYDCLFYIGYRLWSDVGETDEQTTPLLPWMRNARIQGR